MTFAYFFTILSHVTIFDHHILLLYPVISLAVKSVGEIILKSNILEHNCIIINFKTHLHHLIIVMQLRTPWSLAYSEWCITF